jgi:cell division protein FtsB
VLTSEEFQIKQKREEIEVLQQELHSLRTRQEMIENNVSKVANDVNEYIFLLQKYSNA